MSDESAVEPLVAVAADHLTARADVLTRIAEISLGNRFEHWVKWELAAEAHRAIGDGRLPQRSVFVERSSGTDLRCDLFLGGLLPLAGATYPSRDPLDRWIELKACCTADMEGGMGFGRQIAGDLAKQSALAKELGERGGEASCLALVVESRRGVELDVWIRRMIRGVDGTSPCETRDVFARDPSGDPARLGALLLWRVRPQ
jgi:hypothetical protein